MFWPASAIDQNNSIFFSEIIELIRGINSKEPHRPQLPQTESDHDTDVPDLIVNCWDEIPTKRPDFSAIRKRIKSYNKDGWVILTSNNAINPITTIKECQCIHQYVVKNVSACQDSYSICPNKERASERVYFIYKVYYLLSATSKTLIKLAAWKKKHHPAFRLVGQP